DLDLSSAPCSVSGARDLWSVNKKSARLGDEEDVILVKNASGSRILDSVLYSPPGTIDWSEGRSKKTLQKSAGDAVTAGKWKPDASAGNAASSDKMASLKVLAKTGVGNEKASWTVRDMD
ncbi:MAG: hypothetical protein ACTTKL_05315, partial [Treponema sp.]